MPLVPLPTIPVQSFSREFIIDDVKIEITSIDIASHGAFLIAGCSNGVILFFDLTESHGQRNGTFLAQIRPKGMHTTFRLNVKITEDSRICFAGVLKGSSEMVAIDLSSYQLNWGKYRDWNVFKNNTTTTKQKGGNSSSMSSSPVVFESNSIFQQLLFFHYSDAKLRGFGAAACVPPVIVPSSEDGVDGFTSSISMRNYLLACGMGIKNVHLWQVTILDGLTPEELLTKRRDEWTCIYDVASNGMTITHLGFRNEGKELLTKSAGMNIRVWDLTKYMEEPNAKPQYEDIANTYDVKCFLENSTFAYGGTYEFAVVNVDKAIPKEANRDVLELPISMPNSSTTVDDAQSRRRRMMREVQDVIGTQDGVHVLVLCTDGGVMYYKHPCEDEENRKENHTEEAVHIEELTTVQKDPDSNQTWALRRIGNQGMVVLLRAYGKLDKAPRPEPVPAGTIPPMSNSVTQTMKSGVSVISICSLSDLVVKESQHLLTIGKDSVLTWHQSGKFFQNEPATISAEPSFSMMTPSAVISSFASNPSTGDGRTTPRPSLFLDSLNNLENDGIEGKEIIGIASNVPIEEVPAEIPTLKKSASKGLPPTSKKRKAPSSTDLTTIGGIETPQIGNGSVKKVPKIARSLSREEDIPATPAENKSKRTIEGKLFTSNEKKQPSPAILLIGEELEEEADGMVGRLAMVDSAILSPLRIGKSRSESKAPPSSNIRNHREESLKLNSASLSSDFTTSHASIKLGPPPTAQKIIVSDKIIPLSFEEDSSTKAFYESLQAWENLVLYQNYKKDCLPVVIDVPSLHFLSEEHESNHQEHHERFLSYREQYNRMNERFYKEQRRAFYSIVYQLKQFFLEYYDTKRKERQEEHPSLVDVIKPFLASLEQTMVNDLLFRQRQEWKGLQLQWMISMEEINLLKRDSSFFHLQSRLSTISPIFTFESVFRITEKYVQDVMGSESL